MHVGSTKLKLFTLKDFDITYVRQKGRYQRASQKTSALNIPAENLKIRWEQFLKRII